MADGDQPLAATFPPLPSNRVRDELGDRLQAGLSADALREFQRLLDHYQGPLDLVQHQIAAKGYRTAAPRLKTVTGVRMKLERGESKLAGMRDLAGCRVLCGPLDQEGIRDVLSRELPNTTIVKDIGHDRNGYRAVHLQSIIEGRRVEVQVRTDLQQRWAELSEVLGDLWGKDFRYGGTASHASDHDALVVAHRLRNNLQLVSDGIWHYEQSDRAAGAAELMLQEALRIARPGTVMWTLLRRPRAVGLLVGALYARRNQRRVHVRFGRIINGVLDETARTLDELRATL